jgi:hypothetical protein
MFGITPIVGIGDALNIESLTQEYVDVFDENLVSTINQMPIFPAWFFSSEPVYRPFGRQHDNDPHVIIVENKATGQIQFVAGDQEDARQFEAILKEEAKKPAGSAGDVRVCLYNLFSGLVVQQGSDRIDIDAMERNSQMIQLKTQAKFFKGGLHYSDTEIEYLKKWIGEKGHKRMYDLFHGAILNNHPDAIARFENSDIGKVFSEIDASK